LVLVLAGVAYVSFQGIGGAGAPGEDLNPPVTDAGSGSPAPGTPNPVTNPNPGAGTVLENPGESRTTADPDPGEPGTPRTRDRQIPSEAARAGGRIIVSSSVAGGPVTAQIASFRSAEMAASALARVTRRTGLSGVVVPPDTEDGWHRILLGGFDDADAAAEALRPLLNDGTLQDIVIQPLPARWSGRLRGES
jgi:hypothetical protein